VSLLVVLALVAAGAYVLRGRAAALLEPALGTVLGPPCTVRLGDGTERGLSRATATAATTVVGVGLREGRGVDAQARALARVTHAPDDGDEPLAPARAARLLRGAGDVPAPDVREARATVSALRDARPALDCEGERPEVPAETENAEGLTPRAARVLADLRATFGRQPVGGFSPDGVDSGHIEGSAHYEGRAVDVFFRPVTEAQRSAGWAVAQWAVAHGARLRVSVVIYDAQVWSSRFSRDTWHDYRHPSGSTDPTLLHRDHVHVDVLEG
jgi:hypothetical protein